MKAKSKNTLLAILLTLGLTSCAQLAEMSAPSPIATEQTAAGAAEAGKFWAVFHGGKYGQIDELIESHNRVMIQEPNDPITVSHLAWLHAWKLSERSRITNPQAQIIENAFVAKRLFEKAVALKPDEARYLGFAATFNMAEASILDDEKEKRRGYYMMKQAVSMWPEFNLFTSGYVLSRNASDSWQFKEGLEQQWENLDVCFGEKVSRQAPNLQQYLSQETTEGPKRACWNSWIAPHNWEGFFLNFGDMLARSNDLKNAKVMYEATKLSKTYQEWPYKDVAERRIASLNQLPSLLNRNPPEDPEFTSMINSKFSCMGCHQATQTNAR